MRWMRRISIFFIYTCMLLLLGCYLGIRGMRYFYPYDDHGLKQNDNGLDVEIENVISIPDETLCVETEYVIEEYDIKRKTTVETTWKLPDKYIGMNREQFLEAMKLYESFPPLSEKERGFVGLQVLSFSRKKVIIQMNYRFVEPAQGYYIAAYNHCIRVYLDDKETVFIDTDIELDMLPEELQCKVIDMMYIENEEQLYDFLETYSS